MLLYAITSRVLLGEGENERTDKLIANLIALATAWAAGGVDFIQIRENDLTAAELTRIAARIVRAARGSGSHTKVLINARPEIAAKVAMESGADGVHLRGGLDARQLAARILEIEAIWKTRWGSEATLPISVACHSIAEVRAARAAGATLALFAPVFEKILPGAPSLAGTGLAVLAEACQAAREIGEKPPLPVFALGGVTLGNADQCIGAGAAGVAGIRLFLGCDKERIVFGQP